jgi:hypothetical protein
MLAEAEAGRRTCDWWAVAPRNTPTGFCPLAQPRHAFLTMPLPAIILCRR